MNLGTVASVVLGAVLATLGGIVTALWQQRQARRGAARLIYNELILNQSVILGARLGDLKSEDLSRLRDAAWRDQSDKLALLQSYQDFQGLWSTYYILVGLKADNTAQMPPSSTLDAILDTIDDIAFRVGSQAGLSEYVLERTRAGHQRIRSMADLPREERINAWQTYVDEHEIRKGPLRRRFALGRQLSIDPMGSLVTALTPNIAMSVRGGFLAVQFPPQPLPQPLSPSARPSPVSESPSAREMLEKSTLIVSNPIFRPLTGPQASEDAAVASFVDAARDVADGRNFSFTLVQFSFVFSAAEREEFTRAHLTLNLSQDDPSKPQPIAWSMYPTQIEEAVSTSSTMNLGVDLKIVSGNFKKEGADKQSASLVLLATGELTSSPSWEFSATPRSALRGVYRLRLVIRAPEDSHTKIKLMAHGVVRRRNILRRKVLIGMEKSFDLP